LGKLFATFNGTDYGFVNMTANIHAQELGRLARGVKKTMSPKAMRQRRKAARKPRRKRKSAATIT